jgi:outer membrane protein assembly factor BamD (BamD/ComL family)
MIVRAADAARDDPELLEQAKELYRRVIASYPGSLYDAEARRKLREVMEQ